jgi:hypothetical protein
MAEKAGVDLFVKLLSDVEALREGHERALVVMRGMVENWNALLGLTAQNGDKLGEIREALSEIRSVLADHDARLSRLESARL